jgi:hypothetical protein
VERNQGRLGSIGGRIAMSENEEMTKEEKRIIADFLTRLAEGKECPHCHTTIERKEQIGRCIYAQPCGHRLYQGKLRRRN